MEKRAGKTLSGEGKRFGFRFWRRCEENGLQLAKNNGIVNFPCGIKNLPEGPEVKKQKIDIPPKIEGYANLVRI